MMGYEWGLAKEIGKDEGILVFRFGFGICLSVDLEAKTHLASWNPEFWSELNTPKFHQESIQQLTSTRLQTLLLDQRRYPKTE
jgi:hypothetical protein